MTNIYYNASGNPQTLSGLYSASIRSEFLLIQAAFDAFQGAGFNQLPNLTGQASKLLVVNQAGTGLSIAPATITPAGNVAFSSVSVLTGSSVPAVALASSVILSGTSTTTQTQMGLVNIGTINDSASIKDGILTYLNVTGNILTGWDGSRTGINVFINQQTGGTNVSYGLTNLVASAGTVIGSFNVGGVAGVANGRGTLFGSNFVALLHGTGTFWNGVIGQEINYGIGGTASAVDLIGIQVTALAEGQNYGSRDSIGISINSQAGSAGARVALAFGREGAAPPVSATGTLIKIINTGNTGTMPLDTIMDLRQGGASGYLMRAIGIDISGTGRFTQGLKFSGGVNTPGSVFSDGNWGCLIQGNSGGAIADVGLQAASGTVGFRIGSTGAAFAPIGLTIGAGSPAVFDGVGNLSAQTITGTAFKVGANQVVGARDNAWGVATNGSKAAFNGSTATALQTSTALASVIAALTAHGLIGP